MPRQTIKINEFAISFNDDGYDKIDKIMSPIDVDKLMFKNIMDSIFIEQDILPKDNINDAIEYLKNNEVPQIDELYEALFKRETYRHCSIYVSDKNNSKIISAANVGIQHENIDQNQLQQLVNLAYEYDKPNKIMVLFAQMIKFEFDITTELVQKQKKSMYKDQHFMDIEVANELAQPYRDKDVNSQSDY
ncbi:MAG: hypothetical protein EZS28_001800 [Streblomastix strix]|uniref:Uncharacterized protein n=1 Tax=Streblomastix strix TaxID=222440 RepID=A0A5J4X621_9EUKA|nr:MAG: hypothetical protein EZS28_001800 [Streblomastix strix]